MIEKESQIKELYVLTHRNDTELHTYFDYENDLIKKMFPKYIYGNDTMNNYMNYIRKMSVWMIESVLPIRNFYNYTVGRYYDKHTN